MTETSSSNQRARAQVLRVWRETPRLTGTLLGVPESVAGKHLAPAQFIVAHHAAGKTYLVLASRPGAKDGFELLLGASALAALEVAEGRTLEIDPPQGRGFPMDSLRGQDVLLFGVGSGIAALRPVISMIRDDRSTYGRVTLFVGAHTLEDFPYSVEYELWKRDRIDLVRAISRPWVQELFERDPIDLTNTVAFVCGSPQMMQDVTRVLEQAGLPPARIHRNF